MSRIYTDYLNETILTIPDKFIDVKTGESYVVSPITQEQIAYHSKNNTLIHLVFSALNNYLQPQVVQSAGSKELMIELLEIKKMMQRGYLIQNDSKLAVTSDSKKLVADELDMNDIEEMLEAFGG
ncbi:hypothetical protein VBD025_00485 [Virgibacillus flavescens]|uniref:hypothetical protein n=1 Tax=Virgibacillus flavescens TaxID=1611422 RepID=UPI003D33A751